MDTDQKKQWLDAIENRIEHDYFQKINEVSLAQVHRAVSRQTLASVWDNWLKTKQELDRKKSKIAYYLSAEFLMGRWLGNALINLQQYEDIEANLKTVGLDINALIEIEEDAGLGNGGLGRLAACFLDSLATLNLPAMGYGIRYKYGMFEQQIHNYQQIEKPDNWMKNGDAVSIKRSDKTIPIAFGGYVEVKDGGDGRLVYSIKDAEIVNAVAYDVPVVGYATPTVLTLRLWQAESPQGFDLDLFQQEEYMRAVQNQVRAEDISRVLYPNDRSALGKTLRLRQQFFFVSASLQDILKRYKNAWGNDFDHLDQSICIQMNDTHPVIAIAELMRLLVDVEGLEWEKAWSLVIRCCAYTNHTVMSEALEKWPIDIFSSLLPRHYQLIEEINRRFLSFLKQLYPEDWRKHQSMSIIGDGVVKMAWLAIVGSHSVNGVAKLHTEILKNDLLKDWFDIFPDKFNNKTNGITQRRWLLKANPKLAAFITQQIGDKWVTHLQELDKLKPLVDNHELLQEFMAIKRANKERLASYIKIHNGIDVDPTSIFDIQVKRIHEYKRQLLAVVHIMWLYKKIKEDINFDMVPQTFIFGGKAASGYRQAKLIIQLINRLADIINNDPEVSKKIKVVFLANYRVSLAEKIFPAADLSEQISTAGYEASGTGNMKFMLNGALTIGTMDGANIEIVEQVGEENAFIFGLSADEVRKVHNQYHPQEVLSKNIELKETVDLLLEAPLVTNNPNEFLDIFNSLVHGISGNKADFYLVLKDFEAYRAAQQKANMLYRNSNEWAKKAFLNTASAGLFSSDRTIQEYADEIWHIKPIW